MSVGICQTYWISQVLYCTVPCCTVLYCTVLDPPGRVLPLLPGVEPPGGRGARLRGQDSGDPPADRLILCCMRAFEAQIAGLFVDLVEYI